MLVVLYVGATVLYRRETNRPGSVRVCAMLLLQYEVLSLSLDLLSLAPTNAQVKQSCASAFCNLADLPAMHSRLIEEGAVSTVRQDIFCARRLRCELHVFSAALLLLNTPCRKKGQLSTEKRHGVTTRKTHIPARTSYPDIEPPPHSNVIFGPNAQWYRSGASLEVRR